MPNLHNKLIFFLIIGSVSMRRKGGGITGNAVRRSNRESREPQNSSSLFDFVSTVYFINSIVVFQLKTQGATWNGGN